MDQNSGEGEPNHTDAGKQCKKKYAMEETSCELTSFIMSGELDSAKDNSTPSNKVRTFIYPAMAQSALAW